MGFQPIDMETWPRAEHFEYYSGLLKTNYQINVKLDITNLVQEQKKRNLKFFPVFLYAVIRGINQNREFRMAWKEDTLGFYDICHPSYTIFHEDDKTFSDIWTEYDEAFPLFYRNVISDMEQYQDVKGMKTKPGKPENFCPISSIPWISYDAICHDTPGPSKMYFPVVNFARYRKEKEKILLPFSVYANHAAADGYHTSKLIQDIQKLCDTCVEWIDTL